MKIFKTFGAPGLPKACFFTFETPGPPKVLLLRLELLDFQKLDFRTVWSFWSSKSLMFTTFVASGAPKALSL